MNKKVKKRECRVYRNKVFFYGKTAELVSAAIERSGLTGDKWLDKALKNYIKYLKIK